MSAVTINPGLRHPRAVAGGRAQVPERRSPERRLPERRSPERRSSVRLTRRGRVLLVLVLLALLFAVLTVFGAHSAATGQAGSPVETRTVEVGQGDTLWGIASDVAAPGEVREMVHRIQELNAMSGPGVVVGQEIAVPVR